MESELKPCPFCGDIPELFYDTSNNEWRIECGSCWAAMTDGLDQGAETLVEEWNTRVSE